MSLNIKICRDSGGTWSVHGTSPMPVSGRPSLSASLEYAGKACNAAPATIELYVDGMYIVAHQESGWPKALVSSAVKQSPTVRQTADVSGATPWSRLIGWLRARRHLTIKAGPPRLGERQVSNVVSLKLV
jgi:hypothetical protein